MEKKPHQSIALRDLIKDSNKKIQRIAEIGVWKSATTRKILKSCNKIISQYWAIDSWSIEFRDHYYIKKFTDEQWEELYFYACKLMTWFPKLHVVRLDSSDAAKIFPEGYFDLVFIDAEHDYENMIKYIETWLPLVSKGGFLTGHDYKQPRFPGVEKAVTEIFGKVEERNGFVWIKQVKN